jgi:hypothetical protein
MAPRSPRIPARCRGYGDWWATRHPSRRTELSRAAGSARRCGCSGRRRPLAGGAAEPGRRKSWPIRKDQVECSGMPCDVAGEAGPMPRPPSVVGAGTGGRPRRPARVVAGMLAAANRKSNPYGRIAHCGAQDRWPVRHRRSRTRSRRRPPPGPFSHWAPSDFRRTPATSPARRTPHGGAALTSPLTDTDASCTRRHSAAARHTRLPGSGEHQAIGHCHTTRSWSLQAVPRSRPAVAAGPAELLGRFVPIIRPLVWMCR